MSTDLLWQAPLFFVAMILAIALGITVASIGVWLASIILGLFLLLLEWVGDKWYDFTDKIKEKKSPGKKLYKKQGGPW